MCQPRGAHHDEECVEHAWDGAEERDEDLVKRLDALEEAKHAEGAQDLNLPERAKVDAQEGSDANNYDDRVQVVPAAVRWRERR